MQTDDFSAHRAGKALKARRQKLPRILSSQISDGLSKALVEGDDELTSACGLSHFRDELVGYLMPPTFAIAPKLTLSSLAVG